MGKEGKRPAHAAGAAPPADGRPAKKGRAEAASSASALPDEWQTDGAGVEVSILRLHHYPLLVVRAQQHTLIAWVTVCLCGGITTTPSDGTNLLHARRFRLTKANSPRLSQTSFY